MLLIAYQILIIVILFIFRCLILHPVGRLGEGAADTLAHLLNGGSLRAERMHADPILFIASLVLGLGQLNRLTTASPTL